MQPDDLDLEDLKIFLAVVDGGGFTAAARRVGRTQSAVSLRVRKLEGLIGRPLFTRNAHSTIPTPAGEMLEGHARDLLDRSRSALRRLRGPETAGTVRLGLGEVFVPDCLPRVLARFRHAYPGVTLEVQVGLAADLLTRLEAGGLDLVLANREDGQTVPGRVVWREPLCWIAGRAYPHAMPPFAADGALEFVTLPPQCCYRRIACTLLRAAGRQVRIVYSCSTVAGVEAALEAGWGVAVLGRSSLQRCRGLRDVGAGLPPLPSCEIAIFGERHDNGPALGELVRFMEDALRDQAARPLAVPA
ncbi:LysR family transcriptional regulator [Gluconacetobacter tumulisoli]|uniref:LysR family transcriptional regulator n=1 Tax=Gluconacetobacter tumulisoli TaxID=1286189 RepID=A0A7W4K4Z3_9PROT|nr:LysR family transcriptional regulator [Gluconacetobacter tumulisoli]MBB2200504.1 LysR family transcriptional regulator [Gluconacetobacter tumulisoli]